MKAKYKKYLYFISGLSFAIILFLLLVLLKKEDIYIVLQPKDNNIQVGEVTVFKVDVKGDSLSYQWEVNTGEGWRNSTAFGNDSCELIANENTPYSFNNYKYRCKITDKNNEIKYSDVAYIHIEDPIIIENKIEDVYVNEGDKAEIKVIATGDNLSYQWQVDTGEGWRDSIAEGNKSACLLANESTPYSFNNYQYRCKITDKEASTIYTDVIVLYVDSTIKVVSQPKDVYVCVDELSEFCVEAQGNRLSYQWQVNTGEGWRASTANGNNISVLVANQKTPKDFDGYQYRCIITDDNNCSITSRVVVLHVNNLDE